jgi:hypothetical protein
MEIPAGKWCGKCVLCQYDSDDCLFYCKYPKCLPDNALQDEVHGMLRTINEDNWQPLRCPACLTAYPNGATITITAKEGK